MKIIDKIKRFFRLKIFRLIVTFIAIFAVLILMFNSLEFIGDSLAPTYKTFILLIILLMLFVLFIKINKTIKKK